MRIERRRSALATLLGSSAVTTIAALQSLLLLPLYLDVLGPRLYGAWLATGEAFVWMLAFDFGIPNLLIQRTGAALANDDKPSIGRHFAASMTALGVLALVLFIAVSSSSGWIASLFGGGTELAHALELSAFALAATLLGYGFVGLSRGLQDTPFVQVFAIVGAVLSFFVTLGLLRTGHGVDSLAIGLIVRGVATLLGGIAFVAFRVDRTITASLKPDRRAFSDILRHGPPMFAAGASYALMNNSMVALSALMFRPEVAAVVGVTRKAADLVRGILDMVGHAAYGGFAHLFAQQDKAKSARVYREIGAAFSVLAIAALAAYVAVNKTLVQVWVGPEMFGGFDLTVALACTCGLGAWSYMQVSLWRSLGRHNEASVILLTGCLARLASMVLLGYLFGVVGLAIGTILTSAAMGAFASRRIWSDIGLKPKFQTQLWCWRAIPVVLGIACGLFDHAGGWPSVLAIGSGVFLLSAGLLLAVDPALDHYRAALTRRWQRGTA